MSFWSNLLEDTAVGAASGAAGVSPVSSVLKYRNKRMGQEPNNRQAPYAAPSWNEQNPGNEYGLPMYRSGGFLPAGGAGIVGDGTDDPRAEEVVNVAPDGSGVSIAPIMPPSDARASAPDIDSNKPLPNVLSSVFGDLADNGGIAPQASTPAPAISPVSATPPPASTGSIAAASQSPVSDGYAPVIASDAVASDPTPLSPVDYGDRFHALDNVPSDPSQTTHDDGLGLQAAAQDAAPSDGPAPRATVTPPAELPDVEDDPNLLRRQQRLMTDGASDDPWYKRLAVMALRGAAKGGIGGAIGGGLTGVIGKGLYQDKKTKKELDETNEEIKAQDTHQKAAYDAQKSGLEAQHQLIENQLGLNDIQYKLLTQSPEWQQALLTKQMSPEAAKALNTRLGINLTPASWQTFVEKTNPATGASEIRGEFDPWYSVNPTIPADATVPPVSINAGGIPLTLKQPEVGNLIATENQANANRVQGANIHNSTTQLEADKFNAQEQTRVQTEQFKNRMEALKQAGANVGGAGEVKGFADKGSGLLTQMNGLESTINSTDSHVTSQDKEKAQAEYNRLQSEFSDNLSKFNAALGKTQGGMQVLQQLQDMDSKIPAARTINAASVTPVQTNTIRPAAPAGKVLTPAAVKAAAKQHGVSYSSALKQAQSQGYTVQ